MRLFCTQVLKWMDYVWALIFKRHIKEFTLLNLGKHEPGDSHQDISFTFPMLLFR